MSIQCGIGRYKLVCRNCGVLFESTVPIALYCPSSACSQAKRKKWNARRPRKRQMRQA
jgi:hypothetical protein